MLENRIQLRKDKIGSLRSPVQERSRQRRDDILTTTAGLLEGVGLDDLTTILIAREMKISVGSLYHYFPNKQAILYALGEQWLAEYSRVLAAISSQPLETMTIDSFVPFILKRMLAVYKEQNGLLPLVQAMWSIPELQDLDGTHDAMVIGYMEDMFRRLKVGSGAAERNRRGRMWLEMTHALLLTITAQTPPARARRSYADLEVLAATLLRRD